MKRKVWVIAADAGDQVILVRLYCSFRVIGTMKMRGGKLEIDALLMHEPLQAGGAFIVQNLEERVETAFT